MKSSVIAATAALAFTVTFVGLPIDNAGVFATPKAEAKFGSRIKKAAKKVGSGARKAASKVRQFGTTKAGQALGKVAFGASLVVPGGKTIRGVQAAVKIGRAARAGRRAAQADVRRAVEGARGAVEITESVSARVLRN